MQVKICCTVNGIFNVKYWRDLEIWVSGRSSNMAPINRSYTTSYWYAVVTIALYGAPFSSYLTFTNIVTLKSRLGVTQRGIIQ